MIVSQDRTGRGRSSQGGRACLSGNRNRSSCRADTSGGPAAALSAARAVVTQTTWWGLTSHFPGNNRHSCFPWSSPAFPTAGRERASSFQETQRHFWKRNKGFYSWQWRIAWASLHLCDKGVHALEFPLSLFSGCKVLLRSSKWCVYRRTSKHVGRSQSRQVRRNSIFLTQGTHFALIKL